MAHVRRGWWETPWGLPEAGTPLVRFGRRSELCVVFGCNLNDCPGRAAIRLSAIAAAVEKNLPKHQRAVP